MRLARLRHIGRSYVVLIAVVLLFASVAVFTGFVASILTDRRWTSRSDATQRVICAGRAYWVVDADDPEACCLLIELLRLEQERREALEMVRRLRGPPP
jgi:hypothetical protein